MGSRKQNCGLSTQMVRAQMDCDIHIRLMVHELLHLSKLTFVVSFRLRDAEHH